MGACQFSGGHREVLDEKEVAASTISGKTLEEIDLLAEILKDFSVSSEGLSVDDPTYGEVSILCSNRIKGVIHIVPNHWLVHSSDETIGFLDHRGIPCSSVVI